MRDPYPEEGVICPEPAPYGSERKPRPPEGVYESRGPDGKPVLRGILKKHRHVTQSEDCPFSGHVADVIRERKRD